MDPSYSNPNWDLIRSVSSRPKVDFNEGRKSQRQHEVAFREMLAEFKKKYNDPSLTPKERVEAGRGLEYFRAGIYLHEWFGQVFRGYSSERD